MSPAVSDLATELLELADVYREALRLHGVEGCAGCEAMISDRLERVEQAMADAIDQALEPDQDDDELEADELEEAVA